MLTAKQAANRLGLTADSVRALINDGSLRASNFGRGRTPRWRVSEDELNSFIESRRKQKAPARKLNRPMESEFRFV